MTRRVTEPSQEQKALQGRWGVEDLRKRPAPIVAAGGWGIPDLILSFGYTDIPNNTWYPIPFADIAFAPNYIVNEVYGIDITDDGGEPGNDRYEITTLVEGWYASELITQWDQTTTPGTEPWGDVVQRIYPTSTSGFAFSPTEWRDSYDWGDFSLGDHFDFLNNSYIRTWMAPHYVPANRTWNMAAKQTTGVTRGLSGISMKWWFIGADDLDAWTFANVFD